MKYNADAIENPRKIDANMVEGQFLVPGTKQNTITVRRSLVFWTPTIEILVDGFRVYEASAGDDERHFFELLMERSAQRIESEHDAKMRQYGPAFEAIVDLGESFAK